MSVFEIILLAVALAMDAFAVAICKGLATEKATLKNMLIVGAWFGFFQALMPFIGCMLGAAFLTYIEKFDHWIAFILLSLIGANMIKESFTCDVGHNDLFTPKIMLPLAIATSIDALAAGVSFACAGADIIKTIIIIGIITFILSAIGVAFGNVFGCRFKSLAERVGGAVLIFMGLKILYEDFIVTLL
jgi:putative Mn2+ efflux pump MntP